MYSLSMQRISRSASSVFQIWSLAAALIAYNSARICLVQCHALLCISACIHAFSIPHTLSTILGIIIPPACAYRAECTSVIKIPCDKQSFHYSATHSNSLLRLSHSSSLLRLYLAFTTLDLRLHLSLLVV